MNYEKIYESLIGRAKTREKVSGAYYETHHIVPRCLGGDDNPSNLVSLLPEEHYTAHLLLAKMHDNPLLWFAVNMMSSGDGYMDGARSGNKRYAFIRKKLSSHMSDAVHDKWAQKRGFASYVDQCETIWNMYMNEKLSTSDISTSVGMSQSCVQKSIRSYAMATDSHERLSEERRTRRAILGKKIRDNVSEESEQKRLNSLKQVDWTERNRRLSKSRVGSGNPMYGKRFNHSTVKCPHCNKTGGVSAMKRWHFNNCKEKK